MYGFPEDFVLIGSAFFIPVLLSFVMGFDNVEKRMSTKRGAAQMIFLCAFMVALTWCLCIEPYFN